MDVHLWEDANDGWHISHPGHRTVRVKFDTALAIADRLLRETAGSHLIVHYADGRHASEPECGYEWAFAV